VEWRPRVASRVASGLPSWPQTSPLTGRLPTRATLLDARLPSLIRVGSAVLYRHRPACAARHRAGVSSACLDRGPTCAAGWPSAACPPSRCALCIGRAGQTVTVLPWLLSMPTATETDAGRLADPPGRHATGYRGFDPLAVTRAWVARLAAADDVNPPRWPRSGASPEPSKRVHDRRHDPAVLVDGDLSPDVGRRPDRRSPSGAARLQERRCRSGGVRSGPHRILRHSGSSAARRAQPSSSGTPTALRMAPG
jgi:hypothetical protein